VLLSLPSREYHGPDYEPEVPHIYAMRRRFFADIIELHVFRSTEAIIPPPGYEVVAQVERDAAGNWPGEPRRHWNAAPPGEKLGQASLLGLGASAMRTGCTWGRCCCTAQRRAAGSTSLTSRRGREINPWLRRAMSFSMRSPECYGARQRNARRR
jgi:hypothetical protein